MRTPTSENDFTKRELEVLDLMSYGKTRQQIADELGVAYVTIQFHDRNIRMKLSAKSNHMAVAHAFQDGIVH